MSVGSTGMQDMDDTAKSGTANSSSSHGFRTAPRMSRSKLPAHRPTAGPDTNIDQDPGARDPRGSQISDATLPRRVPDRTVPPRLNPPPPPSFHGIGTPPCPSHLIPGHGQMGKVWSVRPVPLRQANETGVERRYLVWLGNSVCEAVPSVVPRSDGLNVEIHGCVFCPSGFELPSKAGLPTGQGVPRLGFGKREGALERTGCSLAHPRTNSSRSCSIWELQKESVRWKGHLSETSSHTYVLCRPSVPSPNSLPSSPVFCPATTPWNM